MKKFLFWVIVIYGLISFTYYIGGYRKTTDKDFIIDTSTPDSIPMKKDSTIKFYKPDTTPYKGNWIDVN